MLRVPAVPMTLHSASVVLRKKYFKCDSSTTELDKRISLKSQAEQKNQIYLRFERFLK